MNKAAIVLLIFVFAAFLLPGCPQEEDSDYVSGKIENVTEESTFTSEIIHQWRILSIVFLLLSIGLIALCYPVANAFNIPELKAWADIELSEAFTTVLLVIVIMAVLVFVELTTQAILLGSEEFTCEPDTYCPVSVATQYIEDYLDKSLVVFSDLMEGSVLAGKLATMSVVFGSNYIWALYAAFSMKVAPEFMIDVTTLTQQMQFLMGMREALVYQQFLLNHVSGTLAPAALLLGIIFRTFFVTRKLGGLLMAFGIGFLLVFPATYALAFYTLQTTLYGSSTTGGDVSTQFCTASCMELSPRAYGEDNGETYTRSNMTVLFPQEEDQTDEDYKNETDKFLEGEYCHTEQFSMGFFDADGLTCAPEEEGCEEKFMELEICEETTTHKVSPVTGENILSCGVVTYKDCPSACRSLPYPNGNPECSSRRTEYYCREILPPQCFITRFANMSDPMLQGMSGEDSGVDCPAECRPMVGLKKEGCEIGYGFTYNGDNMLVDDIKEEMDEDGYEGKSVHHRCEDMYEDSEIGELIADIFCEDDDTAERALTWLGYEDLQEDGTVAWEEGCPNDCRWISTLGKLGAGCDRFCNGLPPETNPNTLWISARNADTIEGQIAIAETSCYMIVPADALNNPACTKCSFLLDPGFASYPPVHQRCDNLCGKAKMVGISKDSGRSAAVDGFDGPAETKAITKLVVPAIILPLLNLVITFMFIRTLSPILGGDVDIPGMTGLIK